MDGKRFKAGDYIFREGDKPTALFLVRSGLVSIQRAQSGATGQNVELARLSDNELLGEMAFFDRQHRSASAVAVTEVDVLELDFESLDKVYLAVPDYLKMVMATIVARMRKANDRIRELQAQIDPRQSVAGPDSEAYGVLSLIQRVGADPAGEEK